ncbi:MAG: response regulator [Acidobacteria bacterium]|nr:response regulator [Acidobacteriota bacterium]
MAVVLVADDEESIRRLVCAIVTLAGHQCFATANGLEAVALFRSNRDSIDLVITDMMMPVMDGVEAIARIRETKAGVPVICMSGYSDKPMPPGVLPLHKPFAVPALLNLVKQVLKR